MRLSEGGGLGGGGGALGGTPRRPSPHMATPFGLFLGQRPPSKRKKLDANPGISMPEVAKALGELWGKLPADKKATFEVQRAA